MKVTSTHFIPLADAALADDQLQDSLKRLSGRLAQGRTAEINTIPEFEQMRADARDIKDHTLEHLDLYLALFEERVVEQGGEVHWAQDDVEARQIVLDICRSVDAKSVTKSKSMVTEEIELVPFLEAQGLETIETDLGEYIIQLRDEKPSHIVAPAVHLNQEQVADTFYQHHQSLGYSDRVDNRRGLVNEARQVLREKFTQADVGISGANFLVAETGSIILVTNEGNAELTTSLPDTHVVVTGIEKMIPTLDDASTMIRLLARSALGIDISAYTSLMTGPRRENEADGPSRFHIVLVDNGRSKMLGSDMQEMLRCIRCSACLNHCPVYLSVGGHAYGSVYNGPMGAVLTPHLASLESSHHLANASSLCGRCESVCPVMIPLPKLLRNWRTREFAQQLTSTGMRWGLGFWGFLSRHPKLYRALAKFGNAALRLCPGNRKGLIEKLPMLAGQWTLHRDLAKPEVGTFSEQYQRRGGVLHEF